MDMIMAALSRHIPFASSIMTMEAEACRAGLLIAIHQGWSDCIIETDCSLLVTALSSLEEDFSDLGRIVEDCKEYMRAIHSI